jgi:hypothetical protein
MTKAYLPPKTVLLKVDYGQPEWREPAPSEPNDARVDVGYASLTHDGSHIWIKFDQNQEIEMDTSGARVIASALVAMADMLECGK